LLEKEVKKLNIEKYYDETEFYQLEELLNFNWGIIEHIKDKHIDIEIFIGSEDKIIDVAKAVDFFKNYGKIYFIKGAGHLLKKSDK
jgi:esterase/lipase